MSDPGYMLEAQGLYKSYGGILALKSVDFHVRAGSVHALVGENGAGKSTLVKILVGAMRPDAGTLRLDGQEVHFSHTADAAARGVAIVSQELSLFPDLDVLANLFPMREICRGPLVSRQRMWAQARPILDELGLVVDPHTLVETLSLEQRQLLEIARALMVQPRVLILDEPTSALHVREVARLHAVLRALRQRNVAVIYISHLLEEVLSLCDEVTVLRDGEVVLASIPASQLKIDEIIQAMLGKKVSASSSLHSTQNNSAERFKQDALRVERLGVPGRLQNVSLEAPSGAIIGVAGLSGSGHRDLLAVLAGVLRPTQGKVWLPNGREIQHSLRATVRQGIALVSGDRRRVGLMLDKPLWENIAQVRAVALRRDGPLLRRNRLYARARAHMQRLGITASSVNQEVGYLSGGNQQKVVFARWLDADPSVLLLDDPTRGIDVGAKQEIYALMRNLAERGAVQVLASTDLRELALLCDRVFVFYGGQICATLEAPYFDDHTILEIMNTGTKR